MYKVENPEEFDGVPELGMGFHFGATASSEPLIVVNGTIGLTTTDIATEALAETFKNIIDRKISELKQQNRRLSEEDFRLSEEELLVGAPVLAINPSEDIKSFINSFSRWIIRTEKYSQRTRLHESPPFPMPTTRSQRFVRFSAFSRDRRVVPGGSLLRGTYVTSELDANQAPSGCAVVGRYALPNPLPAIYRFDTLTPAGFPGLAGTVAPAFGQAGGGTEIELTTGSPPGSVIGPSTIPIY